MIEKRVPKPDAEASPRGAAAGRSRSRLGRLLVGASWWCLLGVALALPVGALPAVDGRVLGADGAPRADVEVRLLPLVGERAYAELLLEGKTEPEAAAAVRTDPAGRYRVETEPGMYRLLVDAPDAPQLQRYLHPLLESRFLGDLRLPPAERLRARVVDADGQPVPGALVEVVHEASGRDAWREGLLFARADADGWAEVTVRAGAGLRVRASAPGLVAGEAETSGGGQREIRLDRGVERPVRVLTASGAPAPGVLVQVGTGRGAAVRTDGEGRAVLRTPGRGSAEIRLVAADGAAVDRTLPALVPEEEEEPGDGANGDPRPVPEAALELPRTAPLDGRVVDSESGAPVAGALVWVRPDASVRSGSGGGFRIDDVPLGDVWVGAAAAGFLGGSETVRLGDPGAPVEVVVGLDPATRVEVDVVDRAGAPLEGVEVRARPADPRHAVRHDWGSEALSGPNGRAVLGPLPHRGSLEIAGRRDDLAPASRAVELPRPAGEEVVELVLGAGRTATARVVDPDDEPLAGAEVEVWADRETSGWAAVLRNRTEAIGRATSDAAGRVILRHLPPGRTRLEVRRSGSATLRVPGIEIPEGDGETDLGTFVLGPEARVEGRVVDPEGRGLADAAVSLRASVGADAWFDPGDVVARTDPDGRFAVGGRQPGEVVELSVRRDGWAQGRLSAVKLPLESPLVVVLQPAAVLEGRVRGPEGGAVARANVSLHREGAAAVGFRQEESAWGTTDEDGRFRIENIAPGAQRLEVVARGHRTWSRALELAPGESRTGLEVRLELGAVVRGRVVTEAGEPVGGVTVIGRSPNDDVPWGDIERTDLEGRFRMDTLEPGLISLQVRPDDRPPVAKQIRVEPGEQEVEIVLPDGRTVRGTVVDDTGAGVLGAEVVAVSRGEGNRVEVRTGADGGFEIVGVGEGSWLVAARHGEKGSGSAELTVGETDPSPVRIELGEAGRLAGKILGAEIGDLAAAQLLAFSPTGAQRLSGSVDWEGNWSVDGAVPGRWFVFLGIAGRDLRAELTLEPGEPEARYDFDLAAGATVRGVVLHAEEPVPGASVALVVDSLLGLQETATDQAGRFEFRGVATGEVSIEAAEASRGRGSARVRVDGDTEVEVTLETTSVAGRVVGAGDLQPVGGARVTWEPLTASPDVRRLLGSSAIADADGTFRLPSVASGPLLVRAEASGRAPAEVQIDVSPGHDVEGLVLELPEASAVVLELEPPVPDSVRVALLGADGAVRSIETLGVEDGRVTLGSATAGPATALVSAAGRATVSVPIVAPADRPVPVGLPPATALVVEVPELVAEGASATLSIRDPAGRPAFELVFGGFARAERELAAGRGGASDLAPGRWEVTVTAPDGRTWSGEATTRPGEPSRLVLE